MICALLFLSRDSGRHRQQPVRPRDVVTATERQRNRRVRAHQQLAIQRHAIGRRGHVPSRGVSADQAVGSYNSRSARAPLSAVAAKGHCAAMIDIYESGVEAAGRFGAVFERDDETAFFYLLDMRRPEGTQIVSAFAVERANNTPADVPVSVRWSETAAIAGLFTGGVLIAVFDLRSAVAKGRYAEGADSRWFRSH
ncbi:MAG: hypothetical protein JWM65_304 [Sphingomonas bacterium]|nr:hypothetical protein [Sphingomonas bacterium]